MNLSDLADHARKVTCLVQSVIRPAGYEVYDGPPHLLPSHNIERHHGARHGRPNKRLTVATWNIYGGRHGHHVMSGLEHLMDKHGVDVFLLQEMPVNSGRPFWESKLFEHWDARYAPDHFCDARRETHHRTTGNAILSRYPIEGAEVIHLPNVSWDFLGKDQVIRRSAIVGYIGDVSVTSTHLDLYCRPEGRKLQVLDLIKRLERPTDRVSIIGMDGNAAYRLFGRRIGRKLEPFLSEVERAGYVDPLKDAKRGFPHFFDYVFVKGANATSKDLKKPNHVVGSDHHPVIATVTWQ